MQTANELKAATNNIRYYVGEILKLNSKQFDLDLEDYQLGEKVKENVLAGSIRFNCSGEIAASCARIIRYCENIERQVEIAEEQDRQR